MEGVDLLCVVTIHQLQYIYKRPSPMHNFVEERSYIALLTAMSTIQVDPMRYVHCTCSELPCDVPGFIDGSSGPDRYHDWVTPSDGNVSEKDLTTGTCRVSRLESLLKNTLSYIEHVPRSRLKTSLLIPRYLRDKYASL